MGRKRKTIGWRARALGVLALAAMLGGAWGWWQLRHWTPDLASYPDQGAEVSAGDGAVHFKTLKALGAQFVYLEASQGDRRDPAFAANLSAAREAGLKVGAVHRFDPCIMADGQQITADDLGLAAVEHDDADRSFDLRTVRDEAERKAVIAALARVDGNVLRAAELLGVSRPTLYDLMHRLGLK